MRWRSPTKSLGLATRSVNAIGDSETLHDRAARCRRRPGGTPSSILEAVLDQTGYLRELEASQDPQDEAAADNLRELVSVAREFEEAPRPRQPTSAAARLLSLEQVSLVADADSVPDASGGVVTLMTLHTAKGLEFPVVFLTGLEDGIFPHLRALGDRRSWPRNAGSPTSASPGRSQRLYLSRAISRSAWGAPPWNPPSRFLDEIPGELVTWTGAVDRAPFVNRYDDDAPSRYGDHGYRARPAARPSSWPRRGWPAAAGCAAAPATGRPELVGRRPGHPRRLGPRHRGRHPRSGRRRAGADRLRRRRRTSSG